MNSLQRLLYLTAFSALMLSCVQIKKSYEETINPKPRQTKERDDFGYSESSTSSSSTSSSSSVSISVHTNQELGEQKESVSLYESAEKLDQIQEELINLPKFKGKKINLYQNFYFYDFQNGRISIQIQDPDLPENIDQYEYIFGKWQEPTAVKVTGNIKMEDFLYPLANIKFSTAKVIHDKMVEEAKNIEGGVPSDHVFFTHMVVAGRPHTTWYSSIKGSRKDVFIDFNPDGELIKRR